MAVTRPPAAHRRKASAVEVYIARPILHHPLLAIIAAGIVAYCAHYSYTGPMYIKTFAEAVFASGGKLSDCHKIVAVGLTASELRCRHRVTKEDGSVDRGVVGFNSVLHEEVPDSCAYDCRCALKSLVTMRKRKPKLARQLTNWEEHTQDAISSAQKICQEVAGDMIRNGARVSAIEG